MGQRRYIAKCGHHWPYASAGALCDEVEEDGKIFSEVRKLRAGVVAVHHSRSYKSINVKGLLNADQSLHLSPRVSESFLRPLNMTHKQQNEENEQSVNVNR